MYETIEYEPKYDIKSSLSIVTIIYTLSVVTVSLRGGKKKFKHYLWSNIHTFCSNVKCSLFSFSCRLSTIVQLRNPLGHIDYVTNF